MFSNILTGSSNGIVVFCAASSNPQKPGPEESLRLDEVSLQGEAGGDWFMPEEGTFAAPRSGYYLFTVHKLGSNISIHKRDFHLVDSDAI